MARMPRPTPIDEPVFDAGVDPGRTAADGHPLDPEDVGGAKGTGPTGEDEREDEDEFDAEKYENTVSGAISLSENYIDMDVSPDRELSARYYLAEPFGNEERGRSGAVSPEVRGAVLGHMPGLLRMFCGTERFVEFKENAGTPTEQADAQTDIVSHVIMSDNDGYINFQSAIDDGLRRKTGVFTWWWEEREIVTRTTFSGLNEDAFALLQLEAADQSDADENISYDVQVTDQTPENLQPGGTLVPEAMSDVTPEDMTVMEAMGQQPEQTFIYSGVLNRRLIRKRARFCAVPPEELILLPVNSADPDKFPLIGRRQEMTISELVAIGHDEDEIRDALDAGTADGGGNNNRTSLADNPERAQRSEGMEDRIFDTGFSDVDPSSEKVKYCVVYILIDKDGDGIAERRKICTVGENNSIIYDEIWEDDTVPFALGCPYPEPHAPFGMSVADMAMDIQEIKSELIRGTLDSLAESISNRLAFWQGKVNIDDVLNTERGAAIRTSDVPSNVLQNFAAPFVGMSSLPVIQYIDQERINRTGVNPASPTGFDPDSTQSTAREAIGSMIDAAQERTEYIARNLAETLFRRLFQGVRNLLLRHQDHRRTISLNGEDVSFDPRSWRADIDVRVLVGTGRSSSAKKVMMLQAIVAEQTMVYEKYGPANGIVTLQHMSNARQDLLRAQGCSNPARYMGKVTPEIEENAKAQAAAAAQKPTPEQLLAQVQTDKNQKDFQAKMAKLAADLQKAGMQDDQKRDQAEMTFAIGVATLLGDYGIKLDDAEMRREMQENGAATQMADAALASAEPKPEAAE